MTTQTMPTETPAERQSRDVIRDAIAEVVSAECEIETDGGERLDERGYSPVTRCLRLPEPGTIEIDDDDAFTIFDMRQRGSELGGYAVMYDPKSGWPISCGFDARLVELKWSLEKGCTATFEIEAE